MYRGIKRERVSLERNHVSIVQSSWVTPTRIEFDKNVLIITQSFWVTKSSKNQIWLILLMVDAIRFYRLEDVTNETINIHNID